MDSSTARFYLTQVPIYHLVGRTSLFVVVKQLDIVTASIKN